MEDIITIQNLHKIFRAKDKEFAALKGVSLKVAKGDIFGVVGFSGAGKSTLIRCINLLETPDSGTVAVNGVFLTGLSEKELERHRQKIGMIFQHFNLLRSKTVYNNIALPLKYLKRTTAEINKKVDELLVLVGLEEKRNAYPSELSGGEKQRVAIARALANDPQILLSDEATSALDPQMTDSILELLRSLNEKLGLTIVIITHEMLVVKEICNKVAVMEAGRIVESGDLYTVFTNPKSEITKQFTSGLLKFDGLSKLLKQTDFINIIGTDGRLFHLVFSGEQANEGWVSRIIKQFNIEADILYGVIEIIQGKPIGSLFIIFRGTEESIQKSLEYLRSNNVSVSRLLEDESTEIKPEAHK
ncbi:methionine import ATP-binding protein MetN [Spirochaetia bacterium]|nr:methionine import ATP-binding protein MetN [Spirochaetia bacterium]